MSSSRMFEKSMPFSTNIPEYLLSMGGRLKADVNEWCVKELVGMYVCIHTVSSNNADDMENPNRMHFAVENDLIHFKLRWVG